MQQLVSENGQFCPRTRDRFAVLKAVSIVLAAMALLLAVSLFYPVHGL